MRIVQRSVLPGFGITMGFTITYLCLIVLIPLSGLFVVTADVSFAEIKQIMSNLLVKRAFYLTFRSSFIAACVNAFFGLLDEPPAYRKTEGPQTLDWTQDAALLTAAFKQLYNIELWRDCWTLDWRVFMALVSGVTDESALGGIMDLRARKIPKRTQGNGEYIKELQLQKMIYAIRKPQKAGQGYQAGLASLFAELKRMSGN